MDPLPLPLGGGSVANWLFREHVGTKEVLETLHSNDVNAVSSDPRKGSCFSWVHAALFLPLDRRMSCLSCLRWSAGGGLVREVGGIFVGKEEGQEGQAREHDRLRPIQGD